MLPLPEHCLSRQSGLSGLSGLSDTRTLCPDNHSTVCPELFSELIRALVCRKTLYLQTFDPSDIQQQLISITSQLTEVIQRLDDQQKLLDTIHSSSTSTNFQLKQLHFRSNSHQRRLNAIQSGPVKQIPSCIPDHIITPMIGIDVMEPVISPENIHVPSEWNILLAENSHTAVTRSTTIDQSAEIDQIPEHHFIVTTEPQSSVGTVEQQHPEEFVIPTFRNTSDLVEVRRSVQIPGQLGLFVLTEVASSKLLCNYSGTIYFLTPKQLQKRQRDPGFTKDRDYYHSAKNVFIIGDRDFLGTYANDSLHEDLYNARFCSFISRRQRFYGTSS